MDIRTGDERCIVFRLEYVVEQVLVWISLGSISGIGLHFCDCFPKYFCAKA